METFSCGFLARRTKVNACDRSTNQGVGSGTGLPGDQSRYSVWKGTAMEHQQRWRAELPDRWARLWAAVNPHPIEPGALGEFAQLYSEQGEDSAARAFPEISAHLASGCQECVTALEEIIFLLRVNEVE